MKKVILALFLGLPSMALAEGPVNSLERSIDESVGAARYEDNFDRTGGDYANFTMRTPVPSACSRTCARDYRCKAWTYVKPGVQGPRARCWLKNTVPPGHPSNCCLSGTKRNVRP